MNLPSRERAAAVVLVAVVAAWTVGLFGFHAPQDFFAFEGVRRPPETPATLPAEHPPWFLTPRPSPDLVVEQAGAVAHLVGAVGVLVAVALLAAAVAVVRRDTRARRRRLALARRIALVGLALALAASFHAQAQDSLVLLELAPYDLVPSDLSTNPWGVRMPVWLAIGWAALAGLGALLLEGAARLLECRRRCGGEP